MSGNTSKEWKIQQFVATARKSYHTASPSSLNAPMEILSKRREESRGEDKDRFFR